MLINVDISADYSSRGTMASFGGNVYLSGNVRNVPVYYGKARQYYVHERKALPGDPFQMSSFIKYLVKSWSR
jgi:hypothetical protein